MTDVTQHARTQGIWEMLPAFEKVKTPWVKKCSTEISRKQDSKGRLISQEVRNSRSCLVHLSVAPPREVLCIHQTVWFEKKARISAWVFISLFIFIYLRIFSFIFPKICVSHCVKCPGLPSERKRQVGSNNRQ